MSEHTHFLVIGSYAEALVGHSHLPVISLYTGASEGQDVYQLALASALASHFWVFGL